MRRALRIAGTVLLAIPIGIALLIALAWVAVQLAPVRGAIRDGVLAALEGQLQGNLRVEDVRWPRLDRVELRGVTLTDRSGARVAALPVVSADLSLWPLLSGQIEISEAEVARPYVYLEPGNPEAGLLSVFEAREPPPPEPGPEGPVSPIPISVQSLCVRDGQVELRAAPERSFELRKLDACVRLQIADSFRLELRRLSDELYHEGQPVLAVAGGASPHADPPHDLARVRVDGSLRVGGTAEPRFDGRVVADGLSSQTLEALGVAADWLQAEIAADVELEGRGESLEVRAQLAAADSRVSVAADLDPEGVLSVQLDTPHLALARLTTLQLEPIALRARGRVELGSPATPIRLHVPGGSYGSIPLPRVDAQAVLSEDGRIQLEEATVAYGSATMILEGERAADGALQAEARLRIPNLSAVPPLERAIAQLAGSIQGQVNVQVTAHGDVSASAELRARDVRVEDQRVEALNVELQARELTDAPRIDAELAARGIEVADQSFRRLRLRVDGGPERYRVRASAVGPQRIRLQAAISQDERGFRAPYLRASARLTTGPLSVRARRVHFVPGELLRVGSLTASHLGATVRGEGAIQLDRGQVNARVSTRVADLGTLTGAFGETEVPGQLTARARIRGQLERPHIDLEAHYWDGPRFGGTRGEAVLRAELALARGRAELQLRAGAGPASGTLELESRFPRGVSLERVLETGRHSLEARLSGLTFAALRNWTPLAGAPAIRGRLESELDVQGNLRRLSAESRTRIDLQPTGAGVPVRIDADVRYADAELVLAAQATDARGRIAAIDANLGARLEPVLANGVDPADLLTRHRWEVALDIASRRLRQLPGAREFGMPAELASLTLAAEGRIRHAPNSEPRGHLTTTLAFEPRVRRARGAVASCSRTKAASLTASGELQSGRLQLRAVGRTAEQPVFRAQTAARVSLLRWARGDSQQIVPTHVRATIDQLDLARVPYICEQMSGVVSGAVEARELFDPRAYVQARLNARAVRWEDNPPLSGSVSARAEPDGLAVEAQLQPGGGLAEISARLPVEFRVRDPALCVDRDGLISGRIRFERVDLAALGAFTPAVARTTGTLDGWAAVRGTLERPRATGRLTLENVSFTLPEQGQRVSNMRATVTLDGRTLLLSDAFIRDRNGVARLSGRLRLESVDAWAAELDLRAENFPVRRTGLLLGRVDANAKIRAETTPQRLEVEIALSEMDVVLTGSTATEVQSLERHPDIVFASELRAEPDEPDEAAEQAEDDRDFRAVLHLRTTEPVWVRRDDFGVQMRADVTVHVAEQTRIRGEVELLRGYVSLLGQSFDIERGRVTFTGGASIDPQLEITAVQTAPGGVEVRLEVTGFVQAPKLAFFVSEESVTAGEALAVLSGSRDPGGVAPERAEQQLASAAVGMTTGLLSLAARREFGDWVPLFSIEQGEQTKIRIGFDANDLIPDFLSGLVRGAYVEGVVAQDVEGETAPRNASAARAAPGGGGILLELLLPGNFVWVAQYGPGNTWSVDLNWRP